MCERLICRMREPWVHSKGQMEWVGHDSFCLWHHFVVAIARERELLLPRSFLGVGDTLRRYASLTSSWPLPSQGTDPYQDKS
ncbi:mCG147445 [Mus musculus]|nr:mCG147445 [Mus musculus]